jgi:hypothetical protein
LGRGGGSFYKEYAKNLNCRIMRLTVYSESSSGEGAGVEALPCILEKMHDKVFVCRASVHSKVLFSNYTSFKKLSNKFEIFPKINAN